MKIRFFVVLSVLLVFGCSSVSETSSGSTEVSAEIKSALSKLEDDAWKAWKNKDGDLMAGILDEKFVDVSSNGAIDKTKTVKLVSEHKCELKKYSFNDRKATMLGKDVVLMVSTISSDFVCDGKAGPTPVRASTVYKKTGDKWLAVLHQAVNDASTGTDAIAPIVNEKLIPNADDEISKQLWKQENEVWEGWVASDKTRYEKHISENLVAVSPTGITTRAEIIKAVEAGDCEVIDTKFDGANTVKISDELTVLMYRSHINAACGGKQVPEHQWHSTIWKKTADSWKAVFISAS